VHHPRDYQKGKCRHCGGISEATGGKTAEHRKLDHVLAQTAVTNILLCSEITVAADSSFELVVGLNF
jgi:hypothetical protein